MHTMRVAVTGLAGGAAAIVLLAAVTLTQKTVSSRNMLTEDAAFQPWAVDTHVHPHSFTFVLRLSQF
jgi:hypothetical protein